MGDSTKEVFGSVRMGGKNLKNVCWNVVKAGVERKDAEWKEVLSSRDEAVKGGYVEVCKKKKERLKGVYIYQNKKEVNEQFGKKKERLKGVYIYIRTKRR